MIDLEKFPTSETAGEMLESVTSGWYERSYVGKWLYQVMGMSLDEVRSVYNDLPEQFFVETATWGLRYHEEKYGIPVRENLSPEVRRRNILQQRGRQTSMTPYTMERLLEDVTGFQVSIADVNDPAIYVPRPSHPNIFEVVLSGDGTAAITTIRELLNRVKQSHTVYELFYYECAKYQVPVNYENGVRFLELIHARYNLPFLYLDGSWKLDGSCQLNGYDSNDVLDFYPVRIQTRSEITEEIRIAEQMRIVSGAGPEIWMETAGGEPAVEHTLRIQAGAPAVIRAEERMRVHTEGARKIETISYMTRMNQMNAARKLDGSRKLDGGRYAL